MSQASSHKMRLSDDEYVASTRWQSGRSKASSKLM